MRRSLWSATLLVLVSVGSIAIAVSSALAQRPEVKFKEGHGCATWELGAAHFLFLCYVSERI
jgi:hypothetical protein